MHHHRLLITVKKPVTKKPVNTPSGPPGSDQRSDRVHLHWLLLLSLLLQSVAPGVWAASAALNSDTEFRHPDSGIWTISCAGKPMWLPIPQQADDQTAINPGATDHAHSDNTRHCLICTNLTGTDTLPAAADYFDFRHSSAARAYSRSSVAITVGQNHELYQSRAPPV